MGVPDQEVTPGVEGGGHQPPRVDTASQSIRTLWWGLPVIRENVPLLQVELGLRENTTLM